MGKTYRDLKKQGKHVFEGPKVKERKAFAPATKTEKPKRGKGSYDRKNAFEEDEENKPEDEQDKACWDGYVKKGTKKKGGKTVNNCVKESASIIKFIEAIITENPSEAHKHLKDAVNQKLQTKISQEIEKPLF